MHQYLRSTIDTCQRALKLLERISDPRARFHTHRFLRFWLQSLARFLYYIAKMFFPASTETRWTTTKSILKTEQYPVKLRCFKAILSEDLRWWTWLHCVAQDSKSYVRGDPHRVRISSSHPHYIPRCKYVQVICAHITEGSLPIPLPSQAPAWLYAGRLYSRSLGGLQAGAATWTSKLTSISGIA